MLCVRGGHVQDREWLYRLHSLQRLGTLCDGTDDSHRLYLQHWVYGTRRRDVLGMRGGKVQDSSWQGRMHRLHRRQVLGCYGLFCVQ